MKDLFVKYAYFLDGLREDAGIKTVDFCSDICEPRTYRMYISGQRVMSQKMLNGFCQKLKITPRDFYNSYNLNDIEEYKKVSDIYNYIRKGQYENARKIMILFDDKEFVNYNSKLFYDFCVIRYNEKTKSIVKAEALSRYRKLINYPKCLEKSIFTHQETMSIAAIAELENEIKETRALEFLTDFITSKSIKLSSSVHKDVLPTAYSLVAYLHGMNGNYEEVVKVADRGIRYCLINDILNELDRLYYYGFLSRHYLDLPNKDYYFKKFLAATFVATDDIKQYQRIVDILTRDTSKEYVAKMMSTPYEEVLKR